MILLTFDVKKHLEKPEFEFLWIAAKFINLVAEEKHAKSTDSHTVKWRVLIVNESWPLTRDTQMKFWI